MINRFSKRIFDKYFSRDNYDNLQKIDERIKAFYLAPILGTVIRKALVIQSNAAFKCGDYKRLKMLNMILNHIEEQSGITALQSMPVQAHINLTSHCNLRCIMCFQAHHKDMERLHMPREILADVSERLFPYLKTIKMDASGEALLYPDFRNIIAVCDRYSNELQLTTNGTLLTEQMADDLLAFKGLKHFCVSFDATTKETFESIRANAKYEAVHRNLSYFCKKRKDLGRDDITVGISFTAMRQNIEHLPILVEMAHDWGINVIYVAYAFISGTSDPGWSLYFHQDLTNRTFDKAYEMGSRLGVGIHLPLRFGQNSSERWRKCSWAWNSVYLHPGGIVGPCCVIQYFTQTDDGRHITDKRENSLTTKKFKDIWNGRSFVQLRKTVNKQNAIYAHCRNSCPVFGRGVAAEIHRHFDPSLYPDEKALYRTRSA